MFDEGSTPAFLKIDNDEVGSFYAIHEHNKVPAEYRPEIPLQADLVKDTDWKDATNKILLIPIPTLIPLPYGKKIESTTFDDNLVEEMQKISSEHCFWAKTMSNVINQVETNNHTAIVFNKIISSAAPSSSRDPACAATKGLRIMTFVTKPFVELSFVGKSFKDEQASMKEFFQRNPTPAHVEINDNNEELKEVHIPMRSASKNQAPPAAPAPMNPPSEFYSQLIETMKNIQALQQLAKIVVKPRNHEESIDLAKLQQLMYASGKINWDNGIAKNICLAPFSQGFLNLLARSASIQATQLSNLFVMIFSTEPKDDDNNTPLNPLNRLMSLIVFPPKFTKGHLNASFQSSNLKAGTIYKSALIHPFHYAPQNNRKLVKEAANEMDEERNKINWQIVKKDTKQISSMIEGVGCMNSMEHIAITCANICGIQLAIMDVSGGKPLLYQFAWKVIRFIENKKTKIWICNNSDCIAHLPMVSILKMI
jgi:hypothetical protein